MNQKIRLSQNLDSYSHLTDVSLRYSDTDKLGHVNNAVFATLFESGRVAMMPEDDLIKAGESGVFVIASIKIDFKAELHIPGTVTIGTTIASFGSASLIFHQGLFKDGVCCATAEAIAVLIDQDSRKPKRITQNIKQMILAYSSAR